MKNDFLKNIIYPLKSVIPDKLYLRLQYRHHFGEKLDLKNPRTYNEKLQWLKLNDRNPNYNKLVDKFLVREYVEQKIGAEYLIPITGVYKKVEEICWNELPEKFVLKCTHGSSSNIICTDKKELNIEEAKEKLKKWMNMNWFFYGREWPYKNLKPRIICENFLETNGEELKDYRFFCFNGEPKFISVDFSITDKTKTRRNLYDLEWNLLDESISYDKELNIDIPKPEKLEKMIEFSKIFSRDIPHARIDFFYIDNSIYFGEITLYHQSGFGQFYPKEFDKTVGNWITLPENI